MYLVFKSLHKPLNSFTNDLLAFELGVQLVVHGVGINLIIN